MPPGRKQAKNSKEEAKLSADGLAAVIAREVARDEKDKATTLKGDLPGYCPYDAAWKAEKIGLREALVREQIRGELIKNERLQLEVEKERGALLTAAEVVERDEAWNLEVDQHCEAIPRLLDGLPGVGPDLRKAFMDRYAAWRRDLSRVMRGAGSAE